MNAWACALRSVPPPVLLLFAGYGVGRLPGPGRAASYIETICLSLTVFLLMVPTVTETLRRVPDGHPLVTDPKSPLLLGAQAALLVVLIVGVTAQLVDSRKRNKAAANKMQPFRGRLPADFKI